MRHTHRIFVIALLSLAAASHAVQRGITEKGDEILLEDDGTWRYAKGGKDNEPVASVGVNAQRFVRNKEAGFPVRSARNNAVVYINPKKWTFSKPQKNPELEFSFRAQAGDHYGMMITERLSVPMEALASIALNNMRNAAPDAEITKQEYRYVNDKKVLYLRINASVKGLKLIYTGYYYSDDGGTTQLVTYTSQNLASAYAADADEFLNGLVIQPAP